MKKKFILVFLFALVVCSCENVTKGEFKGIVMRSAKTIDIGGGYIQYPQILKVI